MFENPAEEFFVYSRLSLCPHEQHRCFLAMIDPVILPTHKFTSLRKGLLPLSAELRVSNPFHQQKIIRTNPLKHLE
jgi:hypothetical protein